MKFTTLAAALATTAAVAISSGALPKHEVNISIAKLAGIAIDTIKGSKSTGGIKTVSIRSLGGERESINRTAGHD